MSFGKRLTLLNLVDLSFCSTALQNEYLTEDDMTIFWASLQELTLHQQLFHQWANAPETEPFHKSLQQEKE
jgi:hypothetical protein